MKTESKKQESKNAPEGQAIKKVIVGSSVYFHGEENMIFLVEKGRQPISIVFDKGVFTVTHERTGERVCFATSNVKCWTPA